MYVDCCALFQHGFSGVSMLTPVTETGFRHRLTDWQISLDCHIGKYWGIIRSIFFFRISNISVPWPHAQLRCRTVIKKEWTFFGPWGWGRSQSPPCWIFRVKQIHQSTASERTTRIWQCWVKLMKTTIIYVGLRPTPKIIKMYFFYVDKQYRSSG